jgi:hypothetical protein
MWHISVIISKTCYVSNLFPSSIFLFHVMERFCSLLEAARIWRRGNREGGGFVTAINRPTSRGSLPIGARFGDGGKLANVFTAILTLAKGIKDNSIGRSTTQTKAKAFRTKTRFSLQFQPWRKASEIYQSTAVLATTTFHCNFNSSGEIISK